jgi:hypothetical protein
MENTSNGISPFVSMIKMVIFITGGFDHTRPFGNGTLTSTGDYDVFVMKYDTSGTFHWATRGGSKKDDWANGICTDNNGSLICRRRASRFLDYTTRSSLKTIINEMPLS